MNSAARDVGMSTEAARLEDTLAEDIFTVNVLHCCELSDGENHGQVDDRDHLALDSASGKSLMPLGPRSLTM